MEKLLPAITIILILAMLSGCVTQQYENNSKEPLTQTKANLNDMAMTRISLGLGYLKMGNTSQAKLNLEKAKNHAPDLPEVHSAFAHYYDQVNEVTLANESYLEALDIDDSNADILNNFGVFLCRQKRFADAEKYMLKAIAIPSYLLVAQSYENLALCLLSDKQFNRAESYLAKSLSHNPSRASALLLMAKLQYAQADYLSAIRYLRNYKKSVQNPSASALALTYKTHMYLKQVSVAKNYANMLMRLFPNSYEAKEYILNKLAMIEADELALQFREERTRSGWSDTENTDFFIVNSRDSAKSKKRTIVLSPKNKSGLTEKKDIEKPSATAPLSSAAAERMKDVIVSSAPVIPREIKQVVNQDNTPVKKLENSLPEVSLAKPETAKKVTAPLTKETSIDADLSKAKSPKTESVPAKVESLQVNTADIIEEKIDADRAIHIVSAGDNLFSISRQYNIRMASLELWNNITRTQLIKIGDVIIVEGPK